VIVGVISTRNLRLCHPSSCVIAGYDPNSIVSGSCDSHNSERRKDHDAVTMKTEGERETTIRIYHNTNLYLTNVRDSSHRRGCTYRHVGGASIQYLNECPLRRKGRREVKSPANSTTHSCKCSRTRVQAFSQSVKPTSLSYYGLSLRERET